MHTRFLRKPVAILLIILIAVTAICGCSHGKDKDPKPSAAPDTTANAGEDSSEDPSLTEDPSAAGYTPHPEGFTPEPGSTEDNTTTDPDATQGAATDSPNATPRPGESEAPHQSASPNTSVPTTSPVNTASPVQPAAPSPVPTDTPKPDPITALTNIAPGKEYSCDLDFDGKTEKISLGVKEREEGKKLLTLMVTLGNSGTVLVDSFYMERYYDGVINNFNTGDNRVEIVISTGAGARDEQIRCYRLDKASEALLIYTFGGRMESVGTDSISVAMYADLMGTWICTNELAFSYDEFALSPLNTEWFVRNEPNRWCTVSAPLFVGFYSSGNDNEFGYLQDGLGADRIYPVSTDLVSRIDFLTDSNVRGFIDVTFDENHTAFYDHMTMDNWFSDLSFIK